MDNNDSVLLPEVEKYKLHNKHVHATRNRLAVGIADREVIMRRVQFGYPSTDWLSL